MKEILALWKKSAAAVGEFTYVGHRVSTSGVCLAAVTAKQDVCWLRIGNVTMWNAAFSKVEWDYLQEECMVSGSMCGGLWCLR